jgi:hypothetical protein
MHGRKEKRIQNFSRENLKGRENSEDLGADEKIILEWILGKTGWVDVDWIHLAQERNL